MFIARGDLFHAGDGYDEDLTKSTIRYHVLLSHKGKDVPDAIDYGPTKDFKWIDNLE